MNLSSIVKKTKLKSSDVIQETNMQRDTLFVYVHVCVCVYVSECGRTRVFVCECVYFSLCYNREQSTLAEIQNFKNNVLRY